MFTGIIKEIGRVKSLNNYSGKTVFLIESEKILSDLEIGSSVSINGVCLTAVEINKDSFSVEAVPESLKISNLSKLKIRDLVNLEPSLRLKDDISGHIVTGHVDGQGKVIKMDKEGDSVVLSVEFPNDLKKYIAYKGSISVDGVSLTVAGLSYNNFKIALIPHTLDNSTLSKKKINDMVNLEVDIISRYLERLSVAEKDEGITTKKLKKLGY